MKVNALMKIKRMNIAKILLVSHLYPLLLYSTLFSVHCEKFHSGSRSSERYRKQTFQPQGVGFEAKEKRFGRQV